MFKYLQIWKLLDLGLAPRQELWKASETQNEEEWRNKSSHPELLFFPFFFFSSYKLSSMVWNIRYLILALELF